jgi:hypothetical protein
MVGDGRIPQLDGDFEIGFKLDRFNIHQGHKNPDPSNTLDFDELLVKIALEECDSPYGCYGKTEPIVTGCHCDIPHPSDEAEKEFHTVIDGGTLKQTMFTYEEASQRREEERNIATFSKLAGQETRNHHSNSKDGKRALLRKVKQLKKLLKSDLKELKTTIVMLKGEAAAQVSEDKLIQSRGEKFDRDPKAVESHGFSGRKNKERVLEESMTNRNAALDAVKKMEENIKKKKVQKKQKKKIWLEDALKVIAEEASKQTTERWIDDGRTEAMKRGMRRPWDGEGGSLYAIWLQQRRGAKKKGEDDDEDGENGFSSEGDESDDEDDDDEMYSDEEDWDSEEEGEELELLE